ncbi:hypothetical protein I307_01717 [Cryptococcus deuterogattii 99/473]|uniref:Uncharacterized protein n=1 Tax=Cryptococcus deuterogattii Ram5 TaxID=1296110 RepID=A0A0D0T087_9TREE|nr:hypothetical protein I352_01557 [Cryptococcus deuterogattii MMRL2647]KIR39002.1 hypothetical protein I313_05151 [Cryptococcus deuterogattii Ram5]KIS02468.1 hypothetical protein L804_00738 [Cryptococcus deuterogattii 2001/935-1]KIY58915.1 hypothetical protein I307_01717 [Cryptococcus deuterogattii 99/473]
MPSYPARSSYIVKSVPTTIIKLENDKEAGKATKMEILSSSKFGEFWGK